MEWCRKRRQEKGREARESREGREGKGRYRRGTNTHHESLKYQGPV